MYTVDPDLYERHKDFVLEHGLGRRQRYERGVYRKEMTDAEIATVLGITERDVTEIRCIAEVDTIPPEAWEEAQAEKDRRRREYLEKRGILPSRGAAIAEV